MVTEDKIQHIFRHASPDEVQVFTETFNKYAKTFGFENDFQVNAFLAQINEEVGISLTPKRENLNYSCHALKALFGYYKRHHSEADADGRCNGHRANQRNIANKAYAGRIGNHLHNDGWKFRGSFYIQLTGRSNYEQIATAISLALGKVYTADDLSADATEVDVSLLASMAFYLTHKLYNAKTVDEMTALVNKHTHSYKQRKKHYQYIASL